MSDWITMPLTDALTFREGPGVLAKDFHTEGVPLIRLSGLKNGANLLDGCNFLDPDLVAKKWDHFRLELGDVLLSTSASLGEVAVVKESGVGAVPYTGIIGFRPKDDRVSGDFIRFMLTAPTFKAQIEAMGVGSVMKHFGPSHLKHMSVRVPPISEQEAIAEVLGAVDDKIAANTKLALTADALASTEFHKTVHGAAFSDQSFGDLATVSGGGTPSTKVLEYWDGDIPWATPTDVTPLQGPFLESTNRMISQAGLSACASPLYPAGSILMTSRATIGAFAIAQTPMAVNQGFIVVQPTDPSLNFWIFHEMRSRVDEFLSLANGATFLELSRGNFKKFKVRLAEPTVMEEFGHAADRLHAVARNALRENAMLAATRDVLLPQLMSGRLRVKDAEKVLENAGV